MRKLNRKLFGWMLAFAYGSGADYVDYGGVHDDVRELTCTGCHDVPSPDSTPGNLFSTSGPHSNDLRRRNAESVFCIH